MTGWFYVVWYGPRVYRDSNRRLHVPVFPSVLQCIYMQNCRPFTLCTPSVSSYILCPVGRIILINIVIRDQQDVHSFQSTVQGESPYMYSRLECIHLFRLLANTLLRRDKFMHTGRSDFRSTRRLDKSSIIVAVSNFMLFDQPVKYVQMLRVMSAVFLAIVFLYTRVRYSCAWLPSNVISRDVS